MPAVAFPAPCRQIALQMARQMALQIAAVEAWTPGGIAECPTLWPGAGTPPAKVPFRLCPGHAVGLQDVQGDSKDVGSRLVFGRGSCGVPES